MLIIIMINAILLLNTGWFLMSQVPYNFGLYAFIMTL